MKRHNQPASGLLGIVTLILLGFLSGCDALNPVVILPTITVPVPYTPRPTLPATPVPPTGQILYQDQFDDPNSGWTTGDYDTGIYRYTDGYYSILANEKDLMEWGIMGGFFADAAIEVDVLPVYLPKDNNNAFGVLCRAQPDGDGYAFRISGDGYYSIYRVTGDDFTPLVDWTESSVILQGGQSNHLKVVCNQMELLFLVNGTIIASVEDATFDRGDVGLIATTYEDDPTEIFYDNLKVTQP